MKRFSLMLAGLLALFLTLPAVANAEVPVVERGKTPVITMHNWVTAVMLNPDVDVPEPEWTRAELLYELTDLDKQVLVGDYVLLMQCYAEQDPSYATMSAAKKKQMSDAFEQIGAVVAEQLKDRKYFNSFIEIINDEVED